MSLLGPKFPINLSGAIYWSVPTKACDSVSVSPRSQRASPKSIKNTRPSRSSMRLDGLTSRWSTARPSTPTLCAYHSASAAWIPIKATACTCDFESL